MTIPIKRESVRLDTLVDACLQELAAELGARRLEVTRQVAQDLPEQPMDRAMIREVIGIVLAESIRSAPAASQLRITVKAGRNVQMLAVKISGSGYTDEQRESLFNGEARPGTLARARALVAQHGGVAWANGRPGRGTTFYFTLPAHPSS